MTRFITLICISAIALLTSTAMAQTDTTFTYQGELKESGAPADGSYDMDFSLWDALSQGRKVVPSVIHNGVSVTEGLFSVELDFGAAAFDNSDRWLEIVVGGNTLTPRQSITRSPYSIQTRGIFVDANNNVGIGTTDPAFPLHIRAAQPYVQYDDTGGGSSWIVGLQSPTVGFNIQEVGVGTHLVISEGGRVGIGTSDPGYPLEVLADNNGTAIHAKCNSSEGIGVFGWASLNNDRFNSTGVYGRSDSISGQGVRGLAASTTGTNYGVIGGSSSASGYDFFALGAGVDYGASSSIRWKSNINNIDHPLDKITRLRGVYFDWDTEHGGHHDVGMIAEEVGEVLPEIVQYEDNGIDAIGMDYSKMTPLLVEAVNALRAEKDAEIAWLRVENAALQGRLDRLERLVSRLTSAQE